MRKTFTNILILFAALAVVTRQSQATIIQLELYDSYPLVDQANVNLQGYATAGDLVQVILAGNNNAIDAPNAFGGVNGDDQLLITLHVGVGQPIPDTGLVDAFLNYNSSLVDSNFYVRFWNAATAGAATDYGNSSLFFLPAGDAFNQAAVDFVPLSGSPHQTDQPFGAMVIPEPSNLFLFGLIGWGIWAWRKWRKFGTA